MIDWSLRVGVDLFGSAEGYVELFMRGENSVHFIPGEVAMVDGDDELDHVGVTDGSAGVA